MATSSACLSRHNIPLWYSTNKSVPKFDSLRGKEARVDVAVVGGGIVGLSTALQLKERGKNVVLIEASKICGGVSGYTTAKASSLHRIIYTNLKRDFGVNEATLYAEMNEAGMNLIEKNMKHYNFDCTLERLPNFTYTCVDKHVELLTSEAEAAAAAGLKTVFTSKTDLPFPVEGAVRLDNQIQLNTFEYCLGLVDALKSYNTPIYENSRVQKVGITAPHLVETSEGSIEADHVVIATHLPILDKSGHFSTCSPVTSYCCAFRLEDESKLPQAMYISVEEPTRSIRTAQTPSGRMLIVAGNGHPMGETPLGDTEKEFENLENWTRKHFPVKEVVNRWFAHDYKPPDNLPYIGQLMRGTKTLYTATGFQKWGIAAGSASGIIIADLIEGKENKWAPLVDARRWDLVRSLKHTVETQLHVGKHFFQDRFKERHALDIEDLAADHGGICRSKEGIVAAYRDQGGNLFTVSPVCVHLGCHVKWNQADRTWDCPCHGSRYNFDGEVIHGPATTNLKKKGAEE